MKVLSSSILEKRYWFPGWDTPQVTGDAQLRVPASHAITVLE